MSSTTHDIDIHEIIDFDQVPFEKMFTVEKTEGSEDPVTMPSKAILRCYGCGQFGFPKIKLCTRCQNTYFCSVKCQKEAWGRHKNHCNASPSHFQKIQQDRAKKLETATNFLATYNKNKDDNASETLTCSVCLEDDTKDAHSTLLLPCGHQFCCQCIKEVYYSKVEEAVCPLCRTPLPFLDGLIDGRAKALLYLAGTKKNKKDRDELGRIALDTIDFSLRAEKGNYMLLHVQGEAYDLLEEYDNARDAYKNAFSRFLEICEKDIQRKRLIEREELSLEPSGDFVIDVDDMEKRVCSVLGKVPNVLPIFTACVIGMAKAMMHSPDKETKSLAAELSRMMLRIEEKSDGFMAVERFVFCAELYGQCYLRLEKPDAALDMLHRALKFGRYKAGLHEIMANCELHKGNFERALFYAAKGYFYEELWDEAGVVRAKNLALWNDIYQKILKKQEESNE